jgi:hypothetical protein
MLFWPGVAGEFMGMLPVTLIFVLSASLVVALIFLPVLGGIAGRMTRTFDRSANALRTRLPWWARAALVPVAFYGIFVGAMQVLNPGYLFGGASPHARVRSSGCPARRSSSARRSCRPSRSARRGSTGRRGGWRRATAARPSGA